jgi:hypothetical protein
VDSLILKSTLLLKTTKPSLRIPCQFIAQMTSKSIPPFFEPGAPPPPLPLLTLQTDLSYMPHPSPTITANEELLPSDTKKVKPQIRSRAASRARSSSPYTIPPTKVKNRVRVAPATPTAPSNDDTQSERSNSEQSELTELSSTRSESPTDLDDELIRKPAGEPGRPGRGGYNLEAAVGWKGKAFEKLQVFGFTLQCHSKSDACFQKYVYDQVEKHLDITKSYLGQPENKRKIVRDAVSHLLMW